VALGDSFACSAFLQLLSGALPVGGGPAVLRIAEYNAGGTFRKSTDLPVSPTAAPLHLQRAIIAGSVKESLTAFINPMFTITPGPAESSPA
jgi:hypothetical protein